MPALKEEYDYYEYASSRRQGTVKKAVPSSAVRKQTRVATKTSSTRSSMTNRNTSTKNLNLKTTTTRDITKNATRIATRDDSFMGQKSKINVSANRKKQTTKNISLDPVVFNNKKINKKPQEMTLKRPVSSVKAKNVAKQKARVKEMFRNVVVGSFVIGMMFLICYRYSTINEAFNELNDLKNELKHKETINAQIESNIKQNTDLAYIENYAKYQLGMQKAKDSQIQKISIRKTDKILQPIEIVEEEEKGFWDNLIEKIKK